MPPREFLWLTHAPAMTRWLKHELAARAPALRFAFARPGLSTFKLGAPVDDAWTPPSSFARAWGFTLGRASSAAQVVALAEALGQGPLRLHVFEREPDVAIELQTQRGERARATRAELLAAAPGRWRVEPSAEPGDVVLDVVVPPAADPDEPWLIGWHVHSPAHGRDPGGVEYQAPPAEAPSRAWSKLEEALRFAGLEVRVGDRAVDIGAAPGGASLALLERGASVVAIDPGPIAAPVLGHPSGFTHLRKPFGELDRHELPRRFGLLVVDVNLAPTIALHYVAELLRRTGARPRWAVLTLKLNDDAVAASLPRLHGKLTALAGPGGRVRVAQLPSHRREVAAIVEWRPDGLSGAGGFG